MKAQLSILLPFDLGLELDFVGKDAHEIVKEVSSRPSAPLTFQNQVLPPARVTAQIYKFGIGMMELSFGLEGELDLFAALSCHTEQLQVGKSPIAHWAKTSVDGLIQRAQHFATHTYDRRLEEVDFFPIIGLEPGDVREADSFLLKHQKALYGIVAGEPNYDALSAFVLDNEKLVNFGYYENELILIKRFGAVVSSGEAGIILEMIRLAFAQYWSLRAYNHVLDAEVDKAQALLAHLPPYYKFWSMPGRYQAFSREALDFVRDKLAIVDSLHNVSASIPRIDTDWHLRTIHKNVEREYDMDDLIRSVDVKLERIEQSYNSARDFLSTNFFIAVEIVLILSLAWMVLDTCLLFVIAQK